MGRPKIWKDIFKTCLVCGNKFVITEQEERCGRGKYCSAYCRNESQKRRVDENFFSQSSHEMAYVLGLAITDGCIIELVGKPKFSRSCNLLTIKSIDKDVLEKTKLLMKSEYSIIKCNKTSAGNQVWRLDTPNKKIVADIALWGVVPRKTFATKFPYNLPSEFYADFIRGVFDGDGNVHHSVGKRNAQKVSVTIVGMKDLLEPISSIVGIEGHLSPYVNIFQWRIWKQVDLIKFHEFLYYSPHLPCMDRKKKVFDEVLDIISKSSKRPQYGFAKQTLITELMKNTHIGQFTL